MQVQIKRIDEYNLQAIGVFLEESAIANRIPERLANCHTILIKPNLLGPFPPERAVTTHPLVVEAMVIYLKKLGKEIWIGDSPGGTVPWERVVKVTGLADVAERHGVPLLSLYEAGAGPTDAKGISLSRGLDKADAIVNLCKYKTHSLMLYTGAVKNLYGLVPGLLKAELHRRYPQPSDFRNVLTEIYKRMSPKIVWNVMDGILGMDGEGPSAGRPHHFGVMFACTSGASLDVVASRMMGFKLADLPYITDALCVDDISPEAVTTAPEWTGFHFKGVSTREVLIRQWAANRIPGVAFKVFRKLFDFEPRFTLSCRMCGVCRDGCPVKAITLTKGEKMPVIDRSKCIKCMCCHELCPFSAIVVHKRFLARLMLRS
jgi:uncharacterized protein (DUF362 family)/NAD-dependent dihydropyrimidine dehydrogenase PreA subunit